MFLLFEVSRWLHIIAGFLALLLFWIPIVTKKGGKTHNRVGWLYVYAMSIVSVSAFYMGLYRIALDPAADASKISFSWFLLFISVLSGASAWYGIRVLRHKRRTAPHRKPVDLLFPTLLLVSGIGVSLYGFSIQMPLLQYFPFLGIGLGAAQLIYWLRSPKLSTHWVIEHISGMMTCSISTLTAFVVFGAPRLLAIESVSILLWFLPTIALTPITVFFVVKYIQKGRRTA